MIPIYEEMMCNHTDSTFRIYDAFGQAQTIIFWNSISIFDDIRIILNNMSDGVYRIFLSKISSSPTITVYPYPLADVKDVLVVSSILVIQKGPELTLLIPELDGEFDNIRCSTLKI